MASLYRKARSPFWYLETIDPGSGTKLNRSTRLRADDETETREAQQLRALAEARELDNPRTAKGESWAAWVPDFLRVHYPEETQAKTYIRAGGAWNNLKTYLHAKAIRSA